MTRHDASIGDLTNFLCRHSSLATGDDSFDELLVQLGDNALVIVLLIVSHLAVWRSRVL